MKNQLNSLTLATAIIKAGQSQNESVVNAFNTVSSWFIANDGFRSQTLTIPDPIAVAYKTLINFTKDPSKYPEPEINNGPEIV
jgi:hypothetical protein